MVSAPNLPATSTVLSAYSTVAASALLVKTILNEIKSLASQIIPQNIQHKIFSKLGFLVGALQSHMTLVVDEYTPDGLAKNDVFIAAELVLTAKLATSGSIARAKILKGPDEDEASLSLFKGEKIEDSFQGIQVVWVLGSVEVEKSNRDFDGSNYDIKSEKRSLELTFHRKFNGKILSSYIPYLLEKAKSLKDEKKTVMIHAIGHSWQSAKLNHPSTFETLAMDPATKKDLIDDLDRFLKRRDFYKRVGKAWKRGYLLYGPPGTGKSSLIAAMANYLKFDVYDLELTGIRANSDFKSLLVNTANRSIIVIEDIDCSAEFHNREADKHGVDNQTKLTLSGLLNFIDGLWSGYGDQRIIVFTTNHKDKLDPALLRPGRMDKHIHMSYCSFTGFKILCSKYLEITHHPRFVQIEEFLMEVEVTPAEIAEELMRSEEVDIVLEAVIALLQRKKDAIDEGKEEDSINGNGISQQNEDDEEPKSSVLHVPVLYQRRPQMRRRMSTI